MGKEKNTYKTKMVGKTLTLLELYLLKKPQCENMKNNKCIILYMTYMLKSIKQVYLQKLVKTFYLLHSKFAVCSLKTSI